MLVIFVVFVVVVIVTVTLNPADCDAVVLFR